MHGEPPTFEEGVLCQNITVRAAAEVKIPPKELNLKGILI